MQITESQRQCLEEALDDLYAIANGERPMRQVDRVTYHLAIGVVRLRPTGFAKLRSDSITSRNVRQLDIEQDGGA